MANGYLTYDPYDFKSLTSGIAAPPQWMFNRPYTTFEDAQNIVSQASNNSSIARSNEMKADEYQRQIDAQDEMSRTAANAGDLTNPEVAQQIVKAGLSKGSLDEAYRFAQTLNQLKDLEPKSKQPQELKFSPNSYGGYMVFDPNTGQVSKQGPFAIPRAAGGANGQRASIGFLNYDTGERLSQDEFEMLTPEEQDGFFPEKLAMNKVEAMREGRRRNKAKAPTEEGPGYLDQISSYVQSIMKPSKKDVVSSGPPGPPPPGMKWRKKGS